MKKLEAMLNGMFAKPRRAAPKSRMVAVLPDGSERVIARRGKLWTCQLPKGETRSSSLVGMQDAVEDYGGKVVRRPL